MAHEVFFSIVLGLGTGLAAADSPLGDAVAAWHLSDSHDSADKDSTLSPTGAVKLGVELQGDERKQSLRRGGDHHLMSHTHLGGKTVFLENLVLSSSRPLNARPSL